MHKKNFHCLKGFIQVQSMLNKKKKKNGVKHFAAEPPADSYSDPCQKGQCGWTV